MAITHCAEYPYRHPQLGVKIRKLKVDFLTGGTWRWVRQWTLIVNIYVFFHWLSRLVTKRSRINKISKDGRFLFIHRHFVTKRLSQWKKIINIHYQCSCSLPDLTPSATSHKVNFRILTPNPHPCTTSWFAYRRQKYYIYWKSLYGVVPHYFSSWLCGAMYKAVDL